MSGSKWSLGGLRFMYVGTTDTERDALAYLRIPGATLRWRFRHFGADVAAIELGPGPLLVLADHRPAPSVLPIYEVDDLDAAMADLSSAGWTIEGPVGTPEGPAVVVWDGSGNQISLLRVDRPGAMDRAYADPTNSHAVPRCRG
ncbi:MAG: VOC family protein [Acidimicrobiales bacterium]